MKSHVRFGCRIFLAANEPFQQIIKRAQFCEKYGFDSVLVDDHLLYGTEAAAAQEPFTTLGAIAAGTRRIRVGIAVTDLVRRHPSIIAQTLATLSNQYPRRLFLGLGAGDPMNQTPFGFSAKHRVSRLEEGLKIIRQLWNSSIDKPQSFKGRFFTLNNAYLQADRNVLGPAKYFLALIPEALKKIDPLANHPGRIWEKLSSPKEQREVIRKIAADIPESDAYNTVIHGTADDCIEQLEGYAKAGCKEFMLTFTPKGGLWSPTNLLSQIRLFARKVLNERN